VSRSLVFVSTLGILGKHEQSLTRCTEPRDPAFMGFDLKVKFWKFGRPVSSETLYGKLSFPFSHLQEEKAPCSCCCCCLVSLSCCLPLLSCNPPLPGVGWRPRDRGLTGSSRSAVLGRVGSFFLIYFSAHVLHRHMRKLLHLTAQVRTLS
jgi:hypothetical protein